MRWPFRRRNPDRYPEWRPDQILTPENRSMVRPNHDEWTSNTYAYRAEVLPAIEPLPFLPENWKLVKDPLPREDYEPIKLVMHDGSEHLFGYALKGVFEKNGGKLYASDIVEPHRVSSQ